MLIHSVMPIDALIPQQPIPERMQIAWGNGYLEGYLENGEFNIQRLESTDPFDYLNESLYPGNKISVSSEKMESSDIVSTHFVPRKRI